MALRQGLSPFALALAQTRHAVAAGATARGTLSLSWGIPALRIAADQIELAARLGLASPWVPLGSRVLPQGIEHGRPGLANWGLSYLQALPARLRGFVTDRLESQWGSRCGRVHRAPAHEMLTRIHAQGGPSNAVQAALVATIAQGFIDAETPPVGGMDASQGEPVALAAWLHSRFGGNGLGLDFGWTRGDGARLIDGDGPLEVPWDLSSDAQSWRIENRAWLLR